MTDLGGAAARLLAGFVVATLCTPAGVSGALLLLPVQLHVLGVASPSVSATNLTYNVVATPAGAVGYRRRRRLDGRLARLLVAGAVPGMVVGVALRSTWLAGDRRFAVVAATVLVLLGGRLVVGALAGWSFDDADGADGADGDGGAVAVTDAEVVTDAAVTNDADVVTDAGAHADGARGGAPVDGGDRGRVAGAGAVPDRASSVAHPGSGRAGAGATRLGTGGVAGDGLPAVWRLGSIAAVAGLVGGIYGIGGGAVIVPWLVGVERLSVRRVAGPALVTTFCTSVVGVLGFIALDLAGRLPGPPIVWTDAVLLGIGGAIGSLVGVRIAPHVPVRLLQLLIGGLAVAAGVRTALG